MATIFLLTQARKKKKTWQLACLQKEGSLGHQLEGSPHTVGHIGFWHGLRDALRGSPPCAMGRNNHRWMDLLQRFNRLGNDGLERRTENGLPKHQENISEHQRTVKVESPLRHDLAHSLLAMKYSFSGRHADGSGRSTDML